MLLKLGYDYSNNSSFQLIKALKIKLKSMKKLNFYYMNLVCS